MPLGNFSKNKTTRFKKYIATLVNRAGNTISGSISGHENVPIGADYEPGCTFNVYVGVAGDVSLTLENGDTAIYSAQNGTQLNGDFIRINTGATSASKLVAWV